MLGCAKLPRRRGGGGGGGGGGGQLLNAQGVQEEVMRGRRRSSPTTGAPTAAPRLGEGGRGSFERWPKDGGSGSRVRIRTMVGERAGVPLAGWHTRPGKRVRPPLARLRFDCGLWRRGPPRRAVRQPRCRCHARSSALQTHERRDGERALAHSLARSLAATHAMTKFGGDANRREVRRAREGKKRAAKWEEDITISESLAVLMVFCTTACLRMMGLYHIHFDWTVSVG